VPEFKVVAFHPRNENTKIYPKAEWQIRFSNYLDRPSIDVSKIRVTPPLRGTNTTTFLSIIISWRSC
jgi:hypothetical protein